MRENGRAILGDVFVEQNAGLGIAQQSRQRRLAVEKWAISQVLTIMLDKVKGVEDRLMRSVPSAQILHQHRNRAAVWGCGQMLIVTSIVAAGAGLRLAAYFIDQKTQIAAVAAVLAVALPVFVFLVLLHALYYYLVRRFQALDAWLLMTDTAVATLSVAAAWLGVSMAACLVILMLAPAATVVVYEAQGCRYQ